MSLSVSVPVQTRPSASDGSGAPTFELGRGLGGGRGRGGHAGAPGEVGDLGERGERGHDDDAHDGPHVVAQAATLLHAVDLLAGGVRLESVARLARLTLLPARRHWI